MTIGAYADGLVGILMPTKTSQRWINDGDAVKSQLEAKGYTVDLQYAQDDIPNQLSQLENEITKGPKALIIASIDGTKDATQALIDGKILVVIECSPRFGPKAFAAIEAYGKGEKIEPRVTNIDRIFTKENAAEYMPEAY